VNIVVFTLVVASLYVPSYSVVASPSSGSSKRKRFQNYNHYHESTVKDERTTSEYNNKQQHHHDQQEPEDDEEPQSTPAPPPSLPCIQLQSKIPISLLLLGIKEYHRSTNRKKIIPSLPSTSSSDVAMNDALEDILIEIESILPDGAKMELPYYKQRRRSESRHSSATHNHTMEPMRNCTLLQELLEKLMEGKQTR
jgi:hypothetical protein